MVRKLLTCMILWFPLAQGLCSVVLTCVHRDLDISVQLFRYPNISSGCSGELENHTAWEDSAITYRTDILRIPAFSDVVL